ncbi:tyrosine-type recombinase/integrase [Loktanella sp. Alg231-35]|uniref:tyrosine-type recombinase/integrase n=1 Tax=Loktanella sp. Alg231-35 TaxID=1922220 RepID=UPI000D54B640|nr:site-specific integrase [Loktanella sp. Alg231-35]
MALNGRSGPLTAALVRSVKTPGKYHDGRGTGLYLRVEPNGSRFWVQRTTINGKRREIGLGSPPVVSLVEAREEAVENKRLIRRGEDPLARKRQARRQKTFEDAAREAHIELSPTWKNPKDRAAFLKTLETYIFPKFGAVPVGDVTSADVRQAILAAREVAPSVARKLTYRVSAVFKWGIAEGLCKANPATSDALALPRVDRAVQHRKSLAYADVATCLAAIHASGAWQATKLAFEFVVLTACRSGEVRAAHWDEVDFGDTDPATSETSATWIVPADRMKMKRPHRVPLSPRAVAVLQEAAKLRDQSGLIFPSARGKVLSDMTLSKLVKELGFDVDVHGFRTSFRTWAQEQTSYPREIAEAALAHKVGDAVEQAYARSDLFEKRRQMMDDWAAWIVSSGGR